MNKALYVARMVKKFSCEQLAKILQIEESVYMEIENSITDLTTEQALQLEKVFEVDSTFFMYTEGREERIINSSFEQVFDMIGSNPLSPDTVRMVSLGTKALEFSVELNRSLFKNYELKQDNIALRKIIDHYKSLREVKA